ncbi:glycoside hydrolase family 130 protein [Sphingomonas sp. Leaf343]|uniref:glycoside hydrolase family 130 protein n=1 Tax=Sphingomonas sp. Leaf343 TaxID=1736345 RepID=UPI0006F2F93D|nr:glycoside hydrolase family 130 protein [Sphingomonas sp. Leaf343]KQR83696.1 glycosidase [Sphingomonas sp. Leaf343]
MSAPLVTVLPVVLRPDPGRTVIRPFLPSDPTGFETPGHPRAERIAARVMGLGDAALTEELDRVRLSLDERHRDLPALLLRRFAEVAGQIPDVAAATDAHRMLIGAYFSAEYSFESAALFNPSIVPHPDRSAAADGATRFILSLRGIGEGHLSSVTFRTGTWAADGGVTVDTPSLTSVAPIVGPLRDDDIFELDCGGSRDPSETVLFPVVPSQSRGIEDLRLTPVTRPDGSSTYVGTFTAVGDRGVEQQMLQTDDFASFRMRPVTGDLAAAKGMALFPRQIGGRYWAIGRQDNENLWLFSSDDPFDWRDGRKLIEPRYPWEYVQMGNCGSPLEIEEGWLLLTHGVGVVRNYCMGAALLDREDPSKVLGRTPVPMLEPGPQDRDGYVPNVVYSCGGLVRGRTLLLPYGIADDYTGFGTVSIDALLAAMEMPD